MPVAHLTRLRAQARASGVYLRVLKNTLVRRAVQGTVFASLAEQMTGPLIYSISEDPVAAAKVLNDFAKTNDKLIREGRQLCWRASGQGWRAGACVDSESQRTARPVARHHAGTGQRFCLCACRLGQTARRSGFLNALCPLF
jgi:hypothetical protein